MFFCNDSQCKNTSSVAFAFFYLESKRSLTLALLVHFSTFARRSLLIVFIFGIWRFGANDPFYVLCLTPLQELMCIHLFLHHMFLYSCVCVFLRLETFPGKRLLPILMANPSGDERKTILCYFSL